MAARAKADESYAHPLGDRRFAWLQVARGTLSVNGTELEAGDGVAIQREPELAIRARTGAEFLLFDLS